MKSLRWLNLSSVWLLLLPAARPALRQAIAATDQLASSRVVSLLRAAFAATAGLGAVHSLAGATTLTTSQSSPASATVGSAVQIAFAITGSKSPAASWTVSGTVPPGLTFNGGATGGTINVATLTLSGTPTTAGSYTLSLRGWERINAGPAGSITYTYVINVSGGVASVAPAFSLQPASQSVSAGANVTFAATATGTPTPAYQWRRNATAIPGATNASLILASVQAADAGDYTVVATNSAGAATSNTATLTVTTAPAPAGPVIATQPAPQHVAPGAAGHVCRGRHRQRPHVSME